MAEIHESVSIVRVPTATVVPDVMRAAQEHLLSRFDYSDPPEASHLQEVVNNEKSAVIFTLRDILGISLETKNGWQEIPIEHYVGTLTLAALDTSTRLIGYIEHVVVDERYEGQGIGERLVRKAIEIGKVNGVSRFDLTSEASKVAAQRLYEKTGFHSRDTVNWRYDVSSNNLYDGPSPAKAQKMLQ